MSMNRRFTAFLGLALLIAVTVIGFVDTGPAAASSANLAVTYSCTLNDDANSQNVLAAAPILGIPLSAASTVPISGNEPATTATVNYGRYLYGNDDTQGALAVTTPENSGASGITLGLATNTSNAYSATIISQSDGVGNSSPATLDNLNAAFAPEARDLRRMIARLPGYPLRA